MNWKAIKKARQRLENEQGTIYKDWGGRTSVALIYPNSYYLGMSSLGYQTVYQLLNSYDNIVCERVFWESKGAEIEEPLGLESQRPLSDFDVLAFSVSYELDYFNIVQVLKSCHIPLLAADRDESHPLVIAGGPCVTANPQPLSPFFDCFAIGEGEAILPELIAVLPEGLRGNRDQMLEELATLPGIYVPELYDGVPVRRQWLDQLDSAATTTVITTPDTALSNMHIIEIARGCGWGCRFCLAGFCFRPFRYRALDNLLAQAENGLQKTRRIGLLAAAVSDHPDVAELVPRLRRMGAELSVSSLRIRPLSTTVLKELAESGAQTITLAPEAGSERLRQMINKGITEDDIIAAVDTIAKQSLRQVKLYFMIGLPTETDNDIDRIIELTLKLKGRIERTGCRIAITVEPFVPKANTPFQWLAMTEAPTLERRMNRIKSGLTKSGIEVRAESVEWSVIQGMLARGDAQLAPILADMTKNSLAAWRRAFKKYGVAPDRHIYCELPVDKPLPWSPIDCAVSPEYLSDELEKARQITGTPPCPPTECHKCGVC